MAMTINKHIVTFEPVDITVTGVTLLSEDEYNANEDLIPLVDSWWWLRSPLAYSRSSAGVVYGIGEVDHDYVKDSWGARPALRIKSCNLVPGDKADLAGHTWTVLRDGLMLCDDIVGETPFRRDWEAEDANVWEKSNIRKWIEAWAREAGIEIEAL